MPDVDVMQDASEIIHYDSQGIPLYIRTRTLSDYPDMRALCHWHEDLEFIRVIKGNMFYHINDKKLMLQENDCILVNARQMHYGCSFHRQDCEFICILLHPSLLTGCKTLFQRDITPLIENRKEAYFHFSAGEKSSLEIMELLDRIVSLKAQKAPFYEMEAVGIFHLLWSRLCKQQSQEPTADTTQLNSDVSIQKDMVSYIHQHYMEKLALSDIAAAGSICRSKCCSIFKRYLRQSPIDFLNAYRLEVSRHLLSNTETNITEIALACGFNHLSYYSKLFLIKFGCTPGEYRKRKGTTRK